MKLLAILTAGLAALTLAACASTNRPEPMTNGHFIDWQGANLHVREWGEGRPLLLIHGASGNSGDLEISLVPALEDQFRVVAYDRPGLGRSRGRPAGAGTLAGQAEAALAVIEAEGLEKPVVVGHSFGGSVALRLALDHPEAISGLVLISAPSHEWPGGIAWYYHWSAAPLIGPVFNRTAVPLVAPRQLESGMQSVFSPQEPPQNYIERAGIRQLLRPGAFAANSDDMVGLKAELIEQSSRYRQMDMPVAILHGDADDTVSHSLHAERMAEEIPDSRLSILPGMGHMPHHFRQALIKEHIEAVYRDAGD